MKKHLTFEFNEYEDNHQFEVISNAFKYHAALDEFREYLRGKIKYGNAGEELEVAQTEFFRILRENGITL